LIRKHLSLLLYVALGMLISLTLLLHDPNIQGSAGAVVDLAIPGLSSVPVRSMTGYGAGHSAMGVWADYADAKRASEWMGGDWLGVYARAGGNVGSSR
jgi:hypothetical protein